MRKLPLSFWTILFSIAILFGGLLPAYSASIYVDLSTYHDTPTSAYGGPAGVTGTWNGIDNGTTSNLKDITDTSTSVSVTVTSYSDSGHVTSTDSDYDRLFADNIYGWSSTWYVNFSGFADGPYDVYLCAPDHPSIGTGAMSVNADSVAQIQSGYTVKSTTVSGGTLSISGTPSGSIYAGLAGVQICAVPIPPSVLLLLSGLAGIVGIRRKLKK
jgi:hypothetical protein